MRNTVRYNGPDRKANDEKALRDIVDYLGVERIPLFGDLVALATCIEHAIPCKSEDGEVRVPSFMSLNMTFGFGGIEGYPFHAFARRYCPRAYREWMTTGKDAQVLDDEGFVVVPTEAKS